MSTTSHNSLGKLTLAFLFCSSVFTGEPSLSENWIGELRLGDAKRFVQVKLKRSQDTVTGTIAFPVSSRSETPLSDIVVTQDRVRFAWTEAARTSFDGRLSGGLLSGSITSASERGALRLAPTVTVSSASQERLVGFYELEPGHILSITEFPYGPVYTDFSTGRVGVLFPSAEDRFFAGPAFQVVPPVAVRCKLSSDRSTNHLTLQWQDESGDHLGRKLSLQREEVTFQNGDVVLSGTLVVPGRAGRHPAIVRIHGSGPQTRRNFLDGWYAYHGVSYLSFDKRGTGKSTGDWLEAGISELADDVLAAVRLLRQRSDIDPDQIGIEGDSEGGWIAPAVAVRDPRIKFILVHAGPAMDYVPELMNEVEENCKARGLSGEDLRNALAFRQNATQMIADGAGLTDDAWAKLQAFVDPYRKETWFRYVSVPRERGPAQKKLYLMARIRSSELWRQIKIPVLALYGGKDLNVPAAKNVAALTEELNEAGNRDYTIKVFPDANHDAFETPKAMMDDEERRFLKRLVPGYLEVSFNWVLAHVNRPK
jgi:pimeloyl-ACP methyl ester carboxylesterase